MVGGLASDRRAPMAGTRTRRQERPAALAQGFELYRTLPAPFARAVFIMFLVAEVHPFVDGNGRVARAMMNAELVAAGEARALVLIVFRDNYLLALDALSRQANPAPLIRALEYARLLTTAVAWGDRDAARHALDRCRAFARPAAARLLLPDGVTFRSALDALGA